MYIYAKRFSILGAVMSRGFSYKKKDVERTQLKAYVPPKIFMTLKLAAASKGYNMADMIESLVVSNLSDFIKIIEERSSSDKPDTQEPPCQGS